MLAVPLWSGTPEAMSLLKSNCFSCHNPMEEKGGLDLTTRKAMLIGGNDGKVIVPGNAAASRFIQSLQPAADPHMPPKSQLSPRAIEALTRWVDAGAEWDASALKDRPRPTHDQLASLPKDYTPVFGLALAPGARQLAIARGNRVVVHDLSKTNKLVATLKGHHDAVQSLGWSADGKWLATGGYRKVRLWDESFNLVREITDLEGRVTAVVFAPDNQSLYIADGVAAASGTVRQWKLKDGARMVEWRAHADTIFSLAISRDGKKLASAGGDQVVKVWNLAERKPISALEGHRGAVYSVAFDSNATRVASASADKRVIVWDLKTNLKATLIRSHKSGVTGLGWSVDDKMLVTSCEDGLARVFTNIESHTGAANSGSAKERRLGGSSGRLHCVAASPDAKLMAVGGHDGTVYLFRDNKLSATLKEE